MENMNKVKFNISFFLTAVALMGISFSSIAQSTLVNDGVITLQPGAELYIQGDYTNDQEGRLNSEGEIYISGDWTNDATEDVFLNGKRGTVVMDGTSDQLIYGEDTKFGILDLSPGQGIVGLMTNAAISTNGVLLLEDRLLALNSNVLDVNNDSPYSIQYKDGGIISEDELSIVKWHIGMMQDIYQVPFQTIDGEEIPVIVNVKSDHNGPIALSTYSTDSYNFPRPLNVTNMTINGFNQALSSIDRFWNVALNDKEADVRFSYSSAEVGENDIDMGQIVAAKWTENGEWDAKAEGGYNDPSSKSFIQENVESGEWVLSSKPDDLSMILYPIPAATELNVEIQSSNADSNERISLQVVDGFGRNLQTVDANVEVTGNHMKLDVTNLPIGYYLVQAQVGDRMISKKFYKEDEQ